MPGPAYISFPGIQSDSDRALFFAHALAFLPLVKRAIMRQGTVLAPYGHS